MIRTIKSIICMITVITLALGTLMPSADLFPPGHAYADTSNSAAAQEEMTGAPSSESAGGDVASGEESGSDSSDNVTGWIERDGKNIYVEEGEPFTGWVKRDGKTIYVEDGEPFTGWVKQDGKTIYVEDGEPFTGWVKRDGKKVYVKNGKLATGWTKYKGKKVYVKNGKLANGWLKYKGKKVYVKNGKLANGWLKYKGKKYYVKKGRPLTGVRKIKSKWYEFSKIRGVYKRTIGDSMDKKAQKYSSGRKYLILVSYDKHRVRIYKGRKNKWKRIKNFKCTLGAKSTPTPKGTFKITGRGTYFDTGWSARCWYWTGFIGSVYLFHSVIYDRSSSPVNVVDGKLGKSVSHGCVRLKLANAKWIYKRIPRGTKVVIY